jgi:predicted ATPase
MIRFGDFELSPEERELHSGGRRLPLREAAIEVLLTLARHPGEVVSKRELCRCAWPGREVDENNLQVEISALRKLLGAGAIVTAQGRGYQFALPLETEAATLPGREEDLAALESLLATARLVTVTGEGGAGKTRLMEALLVRMRHRLPGELCRLTLESLHTGDQVWRALADALQHRLNVRDSIPAVVQEALRARKVLLVLDGCDEVVQPVAELASALIATCPGVSLLVTSREVLRVPTEQVYRLGGLPGRAAIALFETLVNDVTPGLVWTDDLHAAAEAICGQLEGNPLALRLAAMRAGERGGVAELRWRIDGFLDFTQDPAPPRQRSLRASLDASVLRLPLAERRLLRRLAQLAQPVALDSLLALRFDPPLDGWEVVEALGRLADKSLVAVEGGERPEYRISRMTQRYALHLV